MISINSQNIPQLSNTGIFIHQHITVQAAADVTGYNIQYLRRMLRSGGLKGVKIGLVMCIASSSLVTLGKINHAKFFILRSVISEDFDHLPAFFGLSSSKPSSVSESASIKSFAVTAVSSTTRTPWSGLTTSLPA